jgi:hypothetical protein
MGLVQGGERIRESSHEMGRLEPGAVRLAEAYKHVRHHPADLVRPVRAEEDTVGEFQHRPAVRGPGRSSPVSSGRLTPVLTHVLRQPVIPGGLLLAREVGMRKMRVAPSATGCAPSSAGSCRPVRAACTKR